MTNEETNYLVSLVRAFRDNKAPCIVIDSKHQRFQIQAAEYGLREGLLDFKEEGSDYQQYTAWVYKLTALGRKVILDPKAPNEYIDD
jgi:hypothetical protein